jgi:hypothetical protein
MLGLPSVRGGGSQIMTFSADDGVYGYEVTRRGIRCGPCWRCRSSASVAAGWPSRVEAVVVGKCCQSDVAPYGVGNAVANTVSRRELFVPGGRVDIQGPIYAQGVWGRG